MGVAAFIAASDVRDYLDITTTTGQYSDAVIGSNIRAASDYLQRRTGRQFELQSGEAKTFTSYNRAILTIPDLQSVTSVTENGAALTADETYYLIPDRRSSGIFTAIQFRVPDQRRDGPEFLHSAEWWDRGLDWRRSGPYTSDPNDLVVTGTWGYNPLIPGTAPTIPDELLHATKILAAWYTKRPDSVMAGVQVSPEGAVSDFRNVPQEVAVFIEEWRLGDRAVSI
jgi:hypothetical protein